MKTTDVDYTYVIGPDGTRIPVPRRKAFVGEWIEDVDWELSDDPKDEKLTSATIEKLGEILGKDKEVPFKENMNAKCFCDHSMAQHKRGGGPCGACGCSHFTEKLIEKCRYCAELLSIRTAPDETVTRLSYNSGAGNYAHVKCLQEESKKKQKAPERKSWLPAPAPKAPAPKLPPPGHPRQEAIMDGVVLNKDSIGILSAILFKAGVYEIDGSIANQADWDSDELSLLAILDAAV